MVSNETGNVVVPLPQVTISGSGFCRNNSDASIQLAALNIPVYRRSLVSTVNGLHIRYICGFGTHKQSNKRYSKIFPYALYCETAQVIQEHKTTVSSYSIVWKKLIARYNNKNVFNAYLITYLRLVGITSDNQRIQTISKINWSIKLSFFKFKSLGGNRRCLFI